MASLGTDRLPRWLVRTTWGVIGGAALLRAGVAAVRYLQVDELQLLHLAWLRTDGSIPGVDHVVPQFSLLVDLLEPAWRVAPDGLGAVWIARALTWVASLGVLAATGLLGRRLFGPLAGLGAVVTLSLHTSFSERAIEVRSDVFLTLALVGAFASLARAGRHGPLVAGLACAFGLAMNFKVLVAVPFVGLAALLAPPGATWKGRLAVDRALRLTAGLAAGVLAHLAFLALRGDLALFFETITRNLGVAATATSRFDPSRWLVQSAVRNVPFYLLFFRGLVLAARHGRAAWAATPALLFSLAYVALNPTFYPYNFVDVAPFWAIAAGLALAELEVRAGRLGMLLAIVALAVIPAARFVKLLRPTLGDQLAVNRFAAAVTAPGDRVFDGSGLILTRRGPRQWRLHSLMVPRYWAGEFSLASELTRQPVRLFVPSYRTSWLTPSDAAFVERAFPRFRGMLGVAGWVVRRDDFRDGAAPAFLVSGGPHAIVAADPTVGHHVLLDGEPYRGPRQLAPGRHRIAWTGDGPPPPWLALVWSPPGMNRALEELPEELRLFPGFDY